jgi:hypothetical protein
MKSMTDKTSKSPLEYLEKEGTVHVLWHKLKKMEQLNALVNKHLDKNLKQYCKATSYTSGKLTLIAANSSIASQLHIQSAELLKKLKQEPELQSIQTIHCKVQVHTARTQRTATKSKPIKALSAKSASIITNIADNIDDPKLSAALKRLAKNVEKR